MIPGHATPAGTERYRGRFASLHAAAHFRQPHGVVGAADLWLSSIGLGTYLGEPTEAADREYTNAIAAALRSGINVLDTAINYRHQRSERNIGTALKALLQTGEIQRDEVFVCTKAGYLSFDGNMPADPRSYFLKEYIEPGILDPAQLSSGMHCMAPAYLENQIERSLRNLSLDSIDLFYLHNPETQLADVPRDAFHARLRDAFIFLEQQVKNRRLGFYGLATWNAFRIPSDSRDSINLFDVERLAREAGGEQHHFRFVQVPFNLGMPEAHVALTQFKGSQKMSLLQAASRLGIAVFGSATLHQGSLVRGLPPFISQALGMESDAENAIQFARSAPGLTTALIGMGHKQHVAENLKPGLSPPTSQADWIRLFQER